MHQTPCALRTVTTGSHVTAATTPSARRRFTLVEFIVVASIIGTLSAIVLPVYANITARARLAAAQAQTLPAKRF
jgi:Tfp pilus assembly major pilin PilA